MSVITIGRDVHHDVWVPHSRAPKGNCYSQRTVPEVTISKFSEWRRWRGSANQEGAGDCEIQLTFELELRTFAHSLWGFIQPRGERKQANSRRSWAVEVDDRWLGRFKASV